MTMTIDHALRVAHDALEASRENLEEILTNTVGRGYVILGEESETFKSLSPETQEDLITLHEAIAAEKVMKRILGLEDGA